MDYATCAGASVAFIASFYAWWRERRFLWCGIRSLRTATADVTVYVDRDADATIRRRTLSFLLNCVMSGAYLAVVSPPSTLNGGCNACLRVTRKAVLSTLVLFTGPIVDKVALRCFAVEGSWLRCWRSYVLCPIGEELFFRGVLFSLLHRRSSRTQIGVAALLFAVSHSHHIVSWACDEYIDRAGAVPLFDTASSGGRDADLQRVCWRAAAAKLGFVYVFTGVFGVLSGYYYRSVCEGSIAAIAAVHAVCNVMGPPDFAVLRRHDSPPLLKVASAMAYVSGVVGWAWLLLH